MISKKLGATLLLTTILCFNLVSCGFSKSNSEGIDLKGNEKTISKDEDKNSSAESITIDEQAKNYQEKMKEYKNIDKIYMPTYTNGYDFSDINIEDKDIKITYKKGDSKFYITESLLNRGDSYEGKSITLENTARKYNPLFLSVSIDDKDKEKDPKFVYSAEDGVSVSVNIVDEDKVLELEDAVKIMESFVKINYNTDIKSVQSFEPQITDLDQTNINFLNLLYLIKTSKVEDLSNISKLIDPNGDKNVIEDIKTIITKYEVKDLTMGEEPTIEQGDNYINFKTKLYVVNDDKYKELNKTYTDLFDIKSENIDITFKKIDNKWLITKFNLLKDMNIE